MEDESSVRVAVRIRPQIARELIEMCRVCTSVTPGEPQVWLGSDKAFTYDYVFDAPSTQEEVYTTCVEELIEGCFEGYNATVLAYGQTGSGKTYTMGTGLEMEQRYESAGIIPRAVSHLFTGIERVRASARDEGLPSLPEFKVTAYFMELYNEEIIDLLDPAIMRGKPGIKIHEDAGGGIYVTGITTRNVTSVEDTLQCLRAGAVSRTTGSTNMNAQSSRSHAIFTLLIRQQRISPLQDGENSDDVPEFETLSAKFHFVDLAGSERLKRTGATGARAREGISINCGLLALGNVISALGDVTKKVTHVPYRDSKLTRLLQDSLGGNSRTLMIACVSPSDTDFMETLNTLKYANRARNIKNKITVNQDKTSKTISLLRQEIQQLQLELLEYKQGKRIIIEDGSEAINDMFHENQMLTSEANNLRTRFKAQQETIDMLVIKNSQLVAEKDASHWGAASDSDVATVIQGYIKEIEELRTKLCESESLCAQVRKQLNNRTNRLSFSTIGPVPMSGSLLIEDEVRGQNISEILEEAKRDLKQHEQENRKRWKKMSIGDSGGEEEEDNDLENDEENDEESSDESAEDRENYNEELADITSEISIKQKLIEGLEQSQKRLETMRIQYEEKLAHLMDRIRATQDERDKVLATIRHANGADEKLQRVQQEYEKKINGMQKEMKKLQLAQREHTKLMRQRTQHERQLAQLKNELTEMKRTKVNLMNKVKESTNRAKQDTIRKNREIAQLRKETQKKETRIKSLEAENRLKNAVLKRKTEEIAVLKKVPRPGLSNKAAGRYQRRIAYEQETFSPKLAKQKWHNLEQSINKVAYNKQTISSMERDMDRWLKERESLSRQLERVIRKRDRLDPSDMSAYNDQNEQVDALKANIDYIHENIRECQENIMSMEDNKETSELLNSDVCMSGLGDDEMRYLISKLIHMTVNQATVAAQKQAMVDELEGKMKQMEQTTSVQEQLLAYVLRDKDMETYSLMSSLVAADGNTPASTESSRSNSPVDGLMESSNNSIAYSNDSLKRRDKARQKTATTEDMLFTNSAENGNVQEVMNSCMTSSLDSTLSGPTIMESAPFLYPPSSGSTTSAFLRTIPRVPSAPNQLKNLAVTRSDKSSSPVLNRKTYDRQESSSPRLTRKNPTSLSASNINYSRHNSLESTSDITPPASPVPYRRAVSREENVFSRLTSQTSSVRESCPDIGAIVPYTGRASHRSVLACTHIAQGHSKAVLSVDATDELMFSASKDRTVKVWDIYSGQEMQSLGGHPNNVNCVRYSNRNRVCFTVSSSFIKIWDIREQPARCIKTLNSSGLSTPGTAHLMSSNRTIHMPPGETLINDIALSETSGRLYSAAGNIVRIWDLRMYQSFGKLAGGHQAAVMCLAVDSHQSWQNIVATGSKDHYIKVFDVGEGNSSLVSPRLNLDPPHYDGIQSLALYGDTLFSGSRDMCIKKWDLSRGELMQSQNNAHKDWVCGLCFTPGGQLLLSGCRSGVIKMWSAENFHMMGELRAHSSPINAITTNSTSIFTASNDCTVSMWRVRTSYDVSPELSDAS